MRGSEYIEVFKGRYPGFLCKELEKRGIWSMTKWEDGTLTGDLNFIFKAGGALKVKMAKPERMRNPGDAEHDTWEWYGEVGKALRAAQGFLRDLEWGRLPRPHKRRRIRKGKRWVEKRVPDPDASPVEPGMDRALRLAGVKPEKSRRLNKDGSLRHVVYQFTKGAELKLYASGRLKVRGEMAGVYEAVMAAEMAYQESLPKKPPAEKVKIGTFKDGRYHRLRKK